MRVVAAALAAAALGGVLHDSAFRRVPPTHIVRYVPAEGTTATLTGRIVDEPLVYERPGGHFARWLHGRMRTRILLEAVNIRGGNETIPVVGLVRVYVKEAVMDLRRGDRIRLAGRLYRPGGPGNPGD